MTQKWWIVALLGVVLSLVSVVLGVVALVPTRDDGLRWLNEEFWVTLIINFISVAASIGLTVWISFLLLRRQFDFSLSREKLARNRELSDLHEAHTREARISEGDGLTELLASATARLRTMSDLAGGGGNVPDFTFDIADLRSSLDALGKHPFAHLDSSYKLTSLLHDLDQVSRDLIRLAPVGLGFLSQYVRTWRSCARLVADLYSAVLKALPEWKNSGNVPDVPIADAWGGIAELDQWPDGPA